MILRIALALLLVGCMRQTDPVCIPVTTNVLVHTEATVTIGYGAVPDPIRGGELLIFARHPDFASVRGLPGQRPYTTGEMVEMGPYTGLRHVTLPIDRLQIISSEENAPPTEMCIRADARVISPETVYSVSVYKEHQ